MSSKRNSGKTARSERGGKSPAIAQSLNVARSWWWLWLFAVPAITALVYGPALKGPFIFDDYHLPFSDPNASTAGPRFWIGGVRPALGATYWLNFAISGTRPQPYHATNLFLHALTAGIVFLLLKRLLELASVESNRTLLAFFGAGLFLLHPLQTESVAYIAGRSEEVAGLFFVAAWLVYARHLSTPTTFITALQILLLAGAAVAGKESAISLPAILLLTDLYWNPASLFQQIRSRAKLLVPMVVGGLVVSVRILRMLTSGTGAGFDSNGVSPAHYALTQCRVIPIYIRLFLFPVGQNGDWRLPFFTSITDQGAWAYALLMVAFVGLIVWAFRKARLLSFGLAVFLVMLLPTSSVVPIIDALAERRMYVAMLGLVLAMIWVIVRLSPRLPDLHRDRYLGLALLAVLCMEAGLSFERNKIWGSDILFWGNSVEGNSQNTRALQERGRTERGESLHSAIKWAGRGIQ